MSSLRVVVADDAVLLREGIRQLLVAGGCEVVAAVGNVPELRAALVADDSIDVVLLDIRMPPTHTDEGVRALEELRAEGCEVGVLLLSMYSSPMLALRALSAGGATGYLLKDRVKDGATLVDAVRAVAGGGAVVDPEVVALLIRARGESNGMSALTTREREVLQLMAEGASNAGIARRLVLSIKTIDTHIEHIMDKLGLVSTAEEHRRVLAVLEYLRSER